MDVAIDLPDLSGKTALVTGASDGVGVEIARGLAASGARLLLPVRNRAKGDAAVARIRQAVPDAVVELRDLDLARLASVGRLVDDLAPEPIDIFIANAGVVLLGDRIRHLTSDGYELHFQANFLGHALLTRGILAQLRAAHARVAFQISIDAAPSRIRWDDLQLHHRYGALRAYGQAKLALGLFGLELARREPDLHVQLCHPGIAPDTAIADPIRRLLPSAVVGSAVRHLGNPRRQAAEPALRAVTADAASGSLFGPSGLLQLAGPPRQLHPFHALRDDAEARRVWELAALLDR
jgi:NAD(P)-dependent dehydrogenase (short-subunit alcohol dehydrogenase family)